jgi:CHAD domain-containing protein
VSVHTSAAEFLSRHLATLDAEIPSLLLRVTRQSDPEAIHDLRVTIRKLRTLLRLARPIFGRHHTDTIRGVYTQAGRASGSLRDEEVFLELLDKAGKELSGGLAKELGAFREVRQQRERELRTDALRSLETDDIAHARTMLGALLALPVRPKKDRELARFGRGAVLEALAKIDRYRDVESNDVAGLHELRIAYKRFRYTLEFFAPVLPPDLTAAHDAAVKFQKRLGDIHDLDMALVHVDESDKLSSDLRETLARSFREARTKKVAAFDAEMRRAL